MLRSIFQVVKHLFPVGSVMLSTGLFVAAQTTEIQWKESSVSFDESAGTVEVTLVRSQNMTGLATVYYQTVNSTATSPSDFQSISNRQAVFTTGKEEVTITTRINQDFQEEGSETYLLQLFNPSPGTIIGSKKDLIVTILDDDVASIQWSEGVVRVTEDSTFVDLTVVRSGGTGSFVSVNYATSPGTATQVLDFQSKSGTISFASGETQKSIQINLTNDFLTETDEEFTVQLSDPSSGELGLQSQVRVIIEDDESSAGTIGWSVASVQEVESNTQIQLTAVRTGGNQGSVSVLYATSAITASVGEDFEATNGILTWGSGSNTPRSVTVNILDDQSDESDETFNLVLSNILGEATLGQSTVTITIQDNDDVSSPGQVAFIAASMSFEESVGTVSVAVQRTGGSSGELEVNYTFADFTAVNGPDFTGVDGVLQWTDGDTDDKFILVSIVEDASSESDESFSITLTAVDEGTLTDPSMVTISIEDDDINNPGTVVFGTASQTQSEGVGTFKVIVKRVGGGTGAVSVAYQTVEGSALASLDYFSQVGVLNWADGDAADKEITISLINDQLFEGSETFSVKLSNTPGGTVVGAGGTHTVNIQDDEVQPGTWFEFTRILYSGTEGAGQVIISVERFGDGIGAASVQVQSNNADAVAGIDYASLNALVNWSEGDLEAKFVTLVVLDDVSLEQDERVGLILINPSENALIGDVSEAYALIYDDDGNPGELVNLSTRGYVGTGDEVLIGGLIVRNGPQRVLIRAMGPSLPDLSGVVQDPFIQLVRVETEEGKENVLIAENDNWTEDSTQIQPIIDTGLGNMNFYESAILVTLPEGIYTALVSTNGQPGIGSVEIYVDTSAGLPGDLINISTRGRVSDGDEILIGGLIIRGDAPKRVMFRGVGPSIILGGSPSLTDPELLLINQATKEVIHSNDNWIDAENWDEIEATLIAPPMDAESSMILELDPGVYTLQLRSVDGTQGIGSVEIYLLN
ncbi:MAG: hypothetical protein O7C75_19425 [Verrucomicrobia bacterium]|nr:hypothetical protein [Verrucomicrobiota bacterium]